MSTHTINHQPGGKVFVLERDGRRMGYLSYTLPSPSAISIDYVEVDRSLRGSGMGNKLVDAAVAWARENDRTVQARCSFARAVLNASSRNS